VQSNDVYHRFSQYTSKKYRIKMFLT